MKTIYLILSITLFLAVGWALINKSPAESLPQAQKELTIMSNPSPNPSSVSHPSPVSEIKSYQVTLTTDMGNIIIKLNDQETPNTVNNFVTLARKGFYNQTIFHRVIKGFMIQGGDPDGNGSGGPGYKFDDEPFTGDYIRGAVAMANSGPDTNGSQFFIMHADYPLPKNYVIFGQVISGLDTVDKIATAPVTANSSGEQSSPVTPVKIKSVAIVEK